MEARGQCYWVGQVVLENDGGTVAEVEKVEVCDVVGVEEGHVKVGVEEGQQKMGQTEAA